MSTEESRPLTEPEKLRLRADVMEAEAAAHAVRPVREPCPTCGRRRPYEPGEREAWKNSKEMKRVRKLRDKERQAREQE